MAIVRKSVISNSFPEILSLTQAELFDGWEVDPESPPCMWGWSYEVWLIKDSEKSRKRAEDYLAGMPPKRDRAQILADARAAKVAKKAAE